ncbi:MAG: pilus assembly protein N-terminal domain-containing protein [Planctomycetales bacterium]
MGLGTRHSTNNSRRGAVWGAALAAWGVILLADVLHAQPVRVDTTEESQRTVGGLPLLGPGPTVKSPRPPKGPDGVDAFVEHVNSRRADSYLEVVVGRPRIMTLKKPLGGPNSRVSIAVGDPTLVDFDVLSIQQLRIVGRAPGVTDLTIITDNQEPYNFRIQVVWDLDVLRTQLKSLFPSARLRLSQIREHVVVEGQARDSAQVAQILESITHYLSSMAARITRKEKQPSGAVNPGAAAPPGPEELGDGDEPSGAPEITAEERPEFEANFAVPQLINLIQIPTSQQVLLKVKIVELNRRALRTMGVDLNYLFNGDVFTTNIGGGLPEELSVLGTFANVRGDTQVGQFNYILRALRQNNIGTVLAEPNLVCLNGHEANFLAGGEFPIIIPQGLTNFTVEFREFGTRLNFVPHILDNERIRLTLNPQVIERDDINGINFQGTQIPALITRSAHTTIELKQGQTLAMAGLIEVKQLAQTRRIPGLGDLPYIGTLWSGNTSDRIERELLILVTPYIIEPQNQSQVGAGPGDEVKEPNDLEFYLLQRIESRTGRDNRSTTTWDDVWGMARIMDLEKRHVHGQAGFSN